MTGNKACLLSYQELAAVRQLFARFGKCRVFVSTCLTDSKQQPDTPKYPEHTLVLVLPSQRFDMSVRIEANQRAGLPGPLRECACKRCREPRLDHAEENRLAATHFHPKRPGVRVDFSFILNDWVPSILAALKHPLTTTRSCTSRPRLTTKASPQHRQQYAVAANAPSWISPTKLSS